MNPKSKQKKKLSIILRASHFLKKIKMTKSLNVKEFTFDIYECSLHY